jgi:hypothetical protein
MPGAMGWLDLIVFFLKPTAPGHDLATCSFRKAISSGVQEARRCFSSSAIRYFSLGGGISNSLICGWGNDDNKNDKPVSC